MDLHQLSCQELSGVGKQTAEHLSRLNIFSIQDLLFHLPFRYQDRTRVYPIRQLRAGEHAVIDGVLKSVSFPNHGKTKLLCEVSDGTGHVFLRFFYLSPFQQKVLVEGARIRCFSEVRYGHHGFEMFHPEFQLITPDKEIPIDEHLTPIYHATEGVTQNLLKKLTDRALEMLQKGGMLPELIPDALLAQNNFPSLQEAIQFLHRPSTEISIDQLLLGATKFHKRLVFEELLAHRLSMLHVKQSMQAQKAVALTQQQNLSKKFQTQLPFQLTQAQQRVWQEIQDDLQKINPMLRLLQGDVGSGKTVIAALAVLQAIENQCQAAVMAPTEILSEQHYRVFKRWLEPLGVSVVLLSGNVKGVARRDILKNIAEGQSQVIIGTHALFQKEVIFKRLALIVIDEQHRFGVNQRALLRDKAAEDIDCPHQLLMTATPIPRTLAMSLYADLDCSVIDELPPGRTPITTSVISQSRREEIIDRIREACLSGRQAYWVCTLIEESDVLQFQAAEKIFATLQQLLPELQLGLVHGRMKSKEKEAVMQQFQQGEMHLLVATTVIEVGVDVPNASLMIIENAERLGLSQLHQLRGRVGRGTAASHCVLLYQTPLSAYAQDRLAVMRDTTDGFKIAERDLELRGPGEILGTRQTGELTFKVANLLRDRDIFSAVQEAAEFITKHHPELIPDLTSRWLKNVLQYGQV